MTITLDIPEEVERRIQQQVADGDINAVRRLLLEMVIPSLEAHFTEAPKTPDAVLGVFADEPELMDQIVSDAMAARETHPLRISGG